MGSLCAPTASDPCQPSPCSPLAQCSVGPRGQAQCRCPENYHGDGTVCLPQDPCVTNNGGCPSNSTLCLYRKPGQVSWRPQRSPHSLWLWVCHGSPRSLSCPICKTGGGWQPASGRVAVGAQRNSLGSHGHGITPTLPVRAGQASCSCKPGLVSIAHDSSAGCFAYCSAFSCDRSATCQVTPDGKTR